MVGLCLRACVVRDCSNDVKRCNAERRECGGGVFVVVVHVPNVGAEGLRHEQKSFA
jgi:hypothetical protein